MVGMMWFKREPKTVSEKTVENGVVSKLRKKKGSLLKPTRESSERETSTESDKERRRYSDILDMKVSLERRDESDESLYESADCHSDAISASDDAIPRLKTPTISKESLKLAVTDEEVDLANKRKGHRKTMSLSNPLEMVKSFGDEFFDHAKKELEKHSDKKKSRESLWSEEDKDCIHDSTMKLDQVRKNSKMEDKSQSNSRKSSNTEQPKSRKSSKGSSVSALNFLRRKKTPTSLKPVEVVPEATVSTEEILNCTRLFLEIEKNQAAIAAHQPPPPPPETDSDDEPPVPKLVGEHRRRLSRQTSRSKSKVRGKSQSVKVNTLRKSHSGTLKKSKKKGVKTPLAARSRQASIVEQNPLVNKKKNSDSIKHNSWLFSGTKGESRREGSTEEQTAPDADVDTSDANTKDTPDKDNKLGSSWRTATPSGRGVNRAESCRERDAPRRGKHRNASDPNRLTAHNNHDLEPCTAAAPSGSSSSSSLSSRSNESNTVQADQHASQSDWSEEDEPLAAQWADSLPPHVLDSILSLSHTQRKRQEVIHELIVSEGSHVRWLKVLGGVFLRPLESHPALLPPEELRALFPNLPGVRERHARLYADLKTIRTEAPSHIVPIRPLADALLNTLGESGYSACLARFCRGQRMALDSLRERRRKNKELHQFLAAREQLPLCGRLQLRDLLACVWQRLTKYQLLLESVIKTVDENEGDSAEDIARLRRALDTAKDVLHSVDTAIRTAENEHRLRTIVNKLEVRVPGSGPEWDEVRRLDLTQHTLRYEGELSVRNDSNKKCSVLALMLEDCLVLLHREGDKFILKPIPQPSQPGLLSPLIRWDKVLFRPNAAVRNTFFLMNINGIQMHELSSTPSEYANWVKHIQDAPLAKLAEAKPNITPSHQPSRSTDDSGINVSRNPSDASEKSEKSEKSIPHSDDIPSEGERDRASLERSSTERERDDKRVEKEDKEAEVADREEKHTPRRPTVGRISTHASPPPTLHTREALTVLSPAAHTASTALTQHERLRRLDEGISKMLRAKSAVVADILGVPPNCYAQVSELAVADTLGQVDVRGELRLWRQSSRSSDEDSGAEPDLHQLLLAAHAQTSHLLEGLSKMMNVSETTAVSARTRRGRCDRCSHRLGRSSTARSQDESSEPHLDKSLPDEQTLDRRPELPVASSVDLLSDTSFDLLSDLDAGVDVDDDGDDGLDINLSSAEMAARLSTMASGLTGTLSRLLAAYPSLEASRRALRNELSAVRDANDALRARYRTEHQMTDETALSKAGPDQSIQDQPSNGG